MNKKEMLVIAILVIFVIISIVVIALNNSSEEYFPEFRLQDKKILVTSADVDYLGIPRYGIAIFNDGTIYNWDTKLFMKQSADDDLSDELKDLQHKFFQGNLEEQTEAVLKIGVLQDKKINRTDIEKLDKYIENLEDKFDSYFAQYDSGGNIVRVWNYNNNKITKISEFTSYEGLNYTGNSIKILNILNKYGLLNKYDLYHQKVLTLWIIWIIIILLTVLVFLIKTIMYFKKRKSDIKRKVIIFGIVVLIELGVNYLLSHGAIILYL